MLSASDVVPTAGALGYGSRSRATVPVRPPGRHPGRTLATPQRRPRRPRSQRGDRDPATKPFVCAVVSGASQDTGPLEPQDPPISSRRSTARASQVKGSARCWPPDASASKRSPARRTPPGAADLVPHPPRNPQFLERASEVRVDRVDAASRPSDSLAASPLVRKADARHRDRSRGSARARPLCRNPRSRMLMGWSHLRVVLVLGLATASACSSNSRTDSRPPEVSAPPTTGPPAEWLVDHGGGLEVGMLDMSESAASVPSSLRVARRRAAVRRSGSAR